MRANTSWSSVSRLTVTRVRPAACSSAACCASSTPLVVSAMSSMPGSVVRSPTRSARFGAQQRLAAGDAQLAHAELREQARQAHDLVEGQAFVRLQEAVVVVEALLRHAIRAAEIAAVHDRDAQVVQRPRRARSRGGGARQRYGVVKSGWPWSSWLPAIQPRDEALRRKCSVRAAVRRSRRCRRGR